MHNYCLLCFVNCHHSWHLFNNYKRKKWRTIFCIEKKNIRPFEKLSLYHKLFWKAWRNTKSYKCIFQPHSLLTFFAKKKEIPNFWKKCNYSTILVNAKILTPLMNPKSMQARKWCPRKIHEPRWRRKKRFTLLFYL